MRNNRRGFTLAEMIVTLGIMSLLTLSALPLAKMAVKREREIDLQRSLRLMREAIDSYKKLADEKKITVEEDTEGYPPDLQALVAGVISRDPQNASGGKARATEKLVRFLRRIPMDPMTRSYDWGLRSYQDDLDSDTWGGENVYDVYTKSRAVALDGTRYRDW